MSGKQKIATGLGIILLLAGGVFVSFLTGSGTETANTQGASVSEHAQTIMEFCKDESYRPYCYEQEVPKLLDVLPLPDVFEVIRTVKAQDTSYRFCHVLAHELGEREVGKDPQNWIDVIAKGPSDGLCSNGFIHGAAVARFNKEVLSNEEIDAAIPELSIACEARDGWNPTPLDQAICYHGIGHVLLHLTNARVEKSLEVCDVVAGKEDGRDYRRLCDEGVFMQIFQPLEPEDFALVEELPVQPTKETLDAFCARMGGDTAEESACWREGWPLYREELRTPEGIVAFCEDMPNETERQNCLNTALVIQGRHGLGDPGELSELCNALPSKEMQGSCFKLGSVAYVEEDKNASDGAAAFCAYAEDPEIGDICYSNLIDMANFVFGNNVNYFEQLCTALPEEYTSRCEQNMPS